MRKRANKQDLIPLGNAVITNNFSSKKIEGIILFPIEVNIDDGVMRGQIFIPKNQQDDIADVQLNFGHSEPNSNFHDICGKYSHTYIEEREDLPNRMDIKIKDKNFIFRRISITRSGSDEFIFTIIGQCAIKDLCLFDEFVVESKIEGYL